jgi:hypothetical protein
MEVLRASFHEHAFDRLTALVLRQPRARAGWQAYTQAIDPTDRLRSSLTAER